MRDFIRFWALYFLFASTLIAVGCPFHFGVIDGWLVRDTPVRNLVKGGKDVAGTSTPAPSAFDSLSRTEWRRLLKEGGLTLIFRHGARPEGDNDAAFDRQAALGANQLPPSIGQGVCLNERGEAEAQLINKLMQELNVPVGEVLASPVCRTRQTAEIAMRNIAPVVTENGLMCGTMLTPDELSAYLDPLKQRLLAPPPKGTNRVVVAHSCSDVLSQMNVALGTVSGMVVLRYQEEGEPLRTPITLYEFSTLQEVVH